MPLCAHCGARIVWVRTAARRPMPLDEHPTVKGNVEVEWRDYRDDDGRIRYREAMRVRVLGRYAAASDPRERYMPHFATCPNWPGMVRKPRTPPPEGEAG